MERHSLRAAQPEGASREGERKAKRDSRPTSNAEIGEKAVFLLPKTAKRQTIRNYNICHKMQTAGRPALVLSLAACVVALFLCCGCVVPQPTALEQEESFKSHDKVSVGGESIGEYAQLRTAVVHSGKQLDLLEFQRKPLSEDEETVTFSANVRFKPGVENYAIGSAAAVDRRGYFVTAAHCVEADGEKKDVYLMFSGSEQGFVLKKARVVWSGRTSSSDGLDFAVVKIASPLSYVFEWGPLPATNDPVVSVGCAIESLSAGELWMIPFGGKVLANVERQNYGGEGILICHDSPLRKGNSGGPLINREGQLLGVNYSRCSSIDALLRWRKRCGCAARPDLKWLADLIDRDYAALSGKKRRNR